MLPWGPVHRLQFASLVSTIMKVEFKQDSRISIQRRICVILKNKLSKGHVKTVDCSWFYQVCAVCKPTPYQRSYGQAEKE